MILVDELVNERLAEARAWLDDFIAAEWSALCAAARGVEHVPSVIKLLRRRRERMACWRAAKLYELHVELLAVANRYTEGIRMADVQAIGRIVRFEDRGGDVIAVDESGRRFRTRKGSFDWQPDNDRSQPLPPPTSQWRRALAAA
jgi:hypothetical protein